MTTECKYNTDDEGKGDEDDAATSMAGEMDL